MNLPHRSLLLALSAFATMPAMAGFEGQGAPLPPTQSTADDPALSWSAAPMPRGALSVGVVTGFANAPLVRRSADGTEIVELGQVLDLRVGARYALSDRIDIGAGVPMVLSWRSDLFGDGSAPNLGDVRVYGRFGLTGGDSPVHVGLVPELRLPSGSATFNLGDDGLGGSLLAAVSAAPGPLRLTANVGADWRTIEATGNVEPGPGLLAAVAVGVQPLDDFAAFAEWRFQQRLLGAEGAGTPGFVAAARGGEAGVTARGRVGGPVWVGGGALLGAPSGFAASDVRVFATVSARFGGDPEIAEERRERREERRTVEAAPSTVPVIVSIQNEAGIPLDASLRVDGGDAVQATSGEARLSLPAGAHRVDVNVPGFGPQARELELEAGIRTPEEVRFILLPTAGDGVVYVDLGSPEDTPVDDATVRIDGRPIGESASGGGVLIGGLGTEDVLIEASAPAFRDGGMTLTPTADPDSVEFLLARERGAVQVLVTDGEGSAIGDARARFLGPDQLGPYNLGERAKRTFVLRPGSWQVLVSHPEYGLQQRGLDLLDEDTELAVVRFVLQPPEKGEADLDVRVVDPNGDPIVGVEVLLDGQSLGRTSSGGSLYLEDLDEGPRTLSVSAPDLEPAEQSVDLYDGLQEHLIVARWKPGATLFRARAPGGMAPDATVRGSGPASLSALALGKDGVERTTLDPGAWDVLFSSPTLGMTQQSATVAPTPGSLTVIDAQLGAPEAPGTTLALAITDPESKPVNGAVVRLDGSVVGRTATGGTLSVTDAGQGRRQLEVAASPYATSERALRLAGERVEQGLQLDWATGAVRVAVRKGGQPVDTATVRVGGERFIPASPVRPDGTQLFALTPGDWQVLVSAPELGLRQVGLKVPERAQLTEVQVDLDPIDPDAAQTIIRVQAPDGTPIDEAEVRLDDRAPVRAQGGFAAFTDVEDGDHTVTISAPDFEDMVVEDVAIRKGTSQRIVPMSYVPRQFSLVVTGTDGKPVQADIVSTSPEIRDDLRTGADGSLKLDIDPRPWELLVRADGLRVARVKVPGGTEADQLDVKLGPARVLVEGPVLRTTEPIYFETGKSTLGPASRDLLDEMADTLVAHPELVQVEIGGHTDATGSVPLNMRLSQRRAEAVVAALVKRGVAPERLTARGYGPTRPTASNESPDGRAKNRRVEFVSETDE